jgi:hypothetical protein
MLVVGAYGGRSFKESVLVVSCGGCFALRSGGHSGRVGGWIVCRPKIVPSGAWVARYAGRVDVRIKSRILCIRIGRTYFPAD